MKSKLVKLSMMMCFVQGGAGGVSNGAGPGITVDKTAGKRSFLQRKKKISSSNSISTAENCGSGSVNCAKELKRSNSSGVVPEGAANWTISPKCPVLEEKKKQSVVTESNGGHKSETDGRSPSSVSSSNKSVNLMRSPSYQSTVGAMKNDIKLSSKNTNQASSSSPAANNSGKDGGRDGSEKLTAKSSSKGGSGGGGSGGDSSADVVSTVSSTATAATAASIKDAEKKEKKRKALSSSRQKKFFRHFPQVNPEENVINYFSCALVSDILLQGQMYITENYFAFYSNVFGFVTKLLIPVVSVVRISKEKVAKIIPNAIGVATLDERHVFGSFMSREAAYRLMLSVWRPAEVPETPTAAAKVTPDVEISECSIEEDSSCSVSGNESPTQLKNGGVGGPLDQSLLIRQRIGAVPPVVLVGGQMETSSSSAMTGPDAVDGGGGVSPVVQMRQQQQSVEATIRNGDVMGVERLNRGGGLAEEQRRLMATQQGVNFGASTGMVPRAESRMARLKNKLRQINLKFPTDIHIVYLGVVLAIILALFSGFLLYRIMDIQARTNHMDKWKPSRDVDMYDEVLKWQREIQERSVEETQNILNINLEQILKVRKSLESLSSLINGKRDSAAKGVDSAIKT